MDMLPAVTKPFIVELATIELAYGKTEADLIEAPKIFQSEFLDHRLGFIRRELVRCSDSRYCSLTKPRGH